VVNLVNVLIHKYITNMKSIPDISKDRESLREMLLTLSHDFFKMEPWKRFSETDVLGIVPPGHGNKYYVNIMGANKEVFALTAYQGDFALEQFWHLQAGEGQLATGTILSIPHLMVSLDEAKVIDND